MHPDKRLSMPRNKHKNSNWTKHIRVFVLKLCRVCWFLLYLLSGESVSIDSIHRSKLSLLLNICSYKEEEVKKKKVRCESSWSSVHSNIHHLLPVLLLCLVSLLHFALLFENQTCQRYTVRFPDDLNNFKITKKKKKNPTWSTFIVSSGILILADSFSLMYMSAYWLWENSDVGNRNVYILCSSEWETSTFLR